MKRIDWMVLLALSLSLACAGCEALRWQPAVKSKTAVKQQTFTERKQDAIASFEKKRDAAQVQAAVNSWERGEVQKSIGLLTGIIGRNPSDLTARLRLAEIHAAQEDDASAVEQLQECLRLSPDHAEAHHALGLVLSRSAEQASQARFHLQRASELDPENAVYHAAANDAR